jgi:hypothetical protein
MALAALCAPPLASAEEAYRYWNHPHRKYDTCVNVRSDANNPEIRWADWNAVGTGYFVPTPSFWKEDSGETICGDGTRKMRIDLTERVVTNRPAPFTDTARLYFHKGGQGYEPDTVPYGHMWYSRIESPPEPRISRSTLDSRGADPALLSDPASDGTGWGAGRRCESNIGQYRTTATAGPTSPAAWVVGPNKSSGGNYAKYANAGRQQGVFTRDYQPLQWSWVGKHYWRDGSQLVLNRLGGGPTEGYGTIRTILKPGMTVTRCNVHAITSRAYHPNSTAVIGRVTGVYVRFMFGSNEWYGWLLHSYQPFNGGDPANDGAYGTRTCVLVIASTGGCDAPGSPDPHWIGSTLKSGQSMYTDDYLVSDDGRYRLIMQLDGNLVVYGPGGPVWATNRFATGARAIMQTDGNLVVRRPDGSAMCSTGTFAGTSSLVMQNDGNLVIYGPNGPVWATQSGHTCS